MNKDKSLFTTSGHNPILEAFGEIFSDVTTSVAAGTTVGGAIGSAFAGVGAVPGSAVGAFVGLATGLLYGVHDYIASGRSKLDTSSYDKPLSSNRVENYVNAIKSRQSYKDFR